LAQKNKRFHLATAPLPGLYLLAAISCRDEQFALKARRFAGGRIPGTQHRLQLS
jgi:hypothetical protein